MLRTFPTRLLTSFAIVGALACGDDDATAPSVDFPVLSDQLKAQYCIRANMTVGDSESGTLAATDCLVEGDRVDSYVVKVSASGETRLAVTSNFNAILALHEVTNLTTLGSVLLNLVDNEDGNNEEFTTSLVSGKTYILAVIGFNGSLGSYTLSVQNP